MLRMRGMYITIAVLAAAVGSIHAQRYPDLLGQLCATSNLSVKGPAEEIDHFVNEATTRKSRVSDLSQLKWIFKKSHHRFLRHYSQYTDFDRLFKDGSYDCLTATSLLAVALEKLQIDYSIIETNYHIFILAQTSQGEVLLESTDPFHGFVTDPHLIEKRLNEYAMNLLSMSGTGRSDYKYKFSLNNAVSPDKLPGLLYFNKAVVAFNRHDLLAATENLISANRIYSSPRVGELADLILGSKAVNDLDEPTRWAVIKSLRSIIPAANLVVASR